MAARLFPSARLQPLAERDLWHTCPTEDELIVGCFPGVSVVAASDFALDHPSQLPSTFLDPELGTVVTLHAMHSVVDWFAYAVWRDGKIERSLSISPDDGIIEDIGARYSFEEPYWSGEHPATDPEDEDDTYPLPFHPLELGEAALKELFGYQLEGFVDPANLRPESIKLCRFRRS